MSFNEPHNHNALAFVLAGGKGSRLFPLTQKRAKPAVPFGGNYRIIDFALSNLYHSGIRKICVLTQYESQSLHRHIRNGWYPRFGVGVDEFITTLPAMMSESEGWYLGTADSISRHLSLIEGEHPNVVDILGGDHIYMMDVSRFNRFHMKNKADLTISAIPVPVDEAANSFGVLVVDKKMQLIDFEEKPAKPTPIPGQKDFCLASMGNYVFKPKVLVETLKSDHTKKYTSDKAQIQKSPRQYSSHDFGYDIIPGLLKEGKRVFVFNFEKNSIPGAKGNSAYWRDVGNIQQYFTANMELLSNKPFMNLYNNEWKMLTYVESPQPSKVMSTESESGIVINSMLANGVIVDRSHIEHSIISYGCRIRKGGHISNSLLLGRNNVGKNVKLNKCILDKYTIIADGSSLGFDEELDRSRGCHVTEDGITVLPRGVVV